MGGDSMLLARDRDQLIERESVEHQLAYLTISLRQKIHRPRDAGHK
jgi:hypothetical protein